MEQTEEGGISSDTQPKEDVLKQRHQMERSAEEERLT